MISHETKRQIILDAIHVVDEVLYEKWDPIGVNTQPEARDEYSSYAPSILKLTLESVVDEIAAALSRIRTDEMCLPPDPRADLRTAQFLIDKIKQI